MKKIAIILLSTLLLITGCGNSKTTQESEKKKVMVTSFIGYDLVKQIAQDKVDVENILPWGSELHGFEPTTKNIKDISSADLFVYLGDDLEPWVKTLASNDNVVNLSQSYTSDITAESEGHDEHDGHDHSSLHFWCDPLNYLQLLEATKDELIKIDPSNKEFYETNAKAYNDRIMASHEDFMAYVKDHEVTIYFSGHNAMDAFAARYNIDIESLSNDYKPDADLTAKQLVDLQNKLVDTNNHYLFTEELVEPKVAKQIQKSLTKDNYELTILELHSYHNITQKQFEEGVSYADLFEQNIKYIKEASNH